MQYSKLFVLAALLGYSAYFDNNQVSAIKLHESIQLEDFNGADEDEIMEKVFTKYSVEGKDHNGVKNGQRILMKTTAPKAAGVILEATHKLKGSQVPGYLKANFAKTWDRFDINADGFIRAEETHTFMRSLMGKLNKFALAPGSLSDVADGAESKKAAPKKIAPAPKKVAPPAPKVEETQVAAEDPPAEDSAAQTTADDAAAAPADDATVEI